MYLNEIKLIGFVGQDAELKRSQNSKELVRFNVATKASWKNQDSGECDSRAEWHRIVAWGNLTKFAQALKKGEHVYVSGELRYREYEKAVGEGKHTVTMPVAEIHAAEIRRLDPRASEGGAAQLPPPVRYSTRRASAARLSFFTCAAPKGCPECPEPTSNRKILS
jgi:single-strand DNA-binding protein